MFDPTLTVRLWGIRLATHASCLIVLCVVVGGVLSRLALADAVGRPGFAVAGILTGVAIAFLLLGHELIRVWAWGRAGAAAGRVDLALFGGATDLGGHDVTPRAEALGALVAFGILGGLSVGMGLAAILTRHAATWLRAPVRTAAIAAIALVALQAMPALHLDGGRVFHAWCWYLMDSPAAAMRLAAVYTHVVAAGLLGIGIVLVAGAGDRPYWGLASAVAGLQLQGAVRRSVRRANWALGDPSRTLGSLSLGGATRIPASATIDDVIEILVGVHRGISVLVADDGGQVVGVLGMGDLRGTRRSAWDRLTVAELMRPLDDLPRLPLDCTIDRALSALEDRPAAVVVDGGGRPISIVDRVGLLAAIVERTARDADDALTDGDRGTASGS